METKKYKHTMKKTLTTVVLLLVTMAVFTSCNKFKTTESGLEYKFLEKNKKAPLVKMDDILEGEMIVTFEGDTLVNTFGDPKPFTRVEDDQFPGGHNEALLMMHEGDNAIFGIYADSIAQFLEPNQMPKAYVKGAGQRIYYNFHITHILTPEEIQELQEKDIAQMEARRQQLEQMKENEPKLIEEYVKSNNIKTKPTAKGLYVIVNKKGTGKKIADGDKVTVLYAGRFLNGVLFDTNIESVAQAEGRNSGHYAPFTITLGNHEVIPGWEEGLKGLNAGSKVTLLIPSDLAYGPGYGPIPPYSPLLFDIEIVSVNQ